MVTPPASSQSPYAAASPLNLPSSATRAAVANPSSSTSQPAHDTSMLFIGQACHLSDCRREDFLPFHCPNCGHKYCAEHYQPSGPSGHSCSYSLHPERRGHGEEGDFLVPLCPLCEKPPAGWKRGEDPTRVMHQHLEFGGCPVLNQAADEEAKRRKKANQCSERRCTKMIVVRIECEKCKDVFCPSHRAPNQHNCRALASSSSSSSHAASAANARNPNTSSAGMAAGLAAIKRLAIAAEKNVTSGSSAKTPTKSQVSAPPVNAASASASSDPTDASRKGSKNTFGIKIPNGAERTADNGHAPGMPFHAPLDSRPSAYARSSPPCSPPAARTSARPSPPRRTKSERLSQLRALQSRRSKGLKLSEAEQVRLAELMREFKQGGEGIDGDHRSWKGSGGLRSGPGKKDKGDKDGDNCVVC